MTVALAGSTAAAYASLERTRAAFLHPNEEAYFAGLPGPRRRTTFLLGRHAAKQALVRLLPHADPAAIDIVAGAFGQPVVHYPAATPIDVSISHTDTVACALAFPATTPMAIDVEEPDVRRAGVMRTQILPAELELAARCQLAETVAAAVVWTAKEAVSKALRCGMTCPFALLAIETMRRSGDRTLTGTFANFAQYRFDTWTLARSVVSIVLPKTVALDLDLAPLLALDGGA